MVFVVAPHVLLRINSGLVFDLESTSGFQVPLGLLLLDCSVEALLDNAAFLSVDVLYDGFLYSIYCSPLGEIGAQRWL